MCVQGGDFYMGGVSSIERVSLSIEVRLFFLLLLYILF